MDQKIIKIVRHILTARIDHADDQSSYIAYCNARDIFEYAVAGNYDCLAQYDYLLTKEDCGLD